MGVVADIERKLARRRCEHEEDDAPTLRTSTMTHLVWAPPPWLAQARRVLDGLAERHPARTIFLIPMPGRRAGIDADATVRSFGSNGRRAMISEVVEIRLHGRAAHHPASLAVPLLISGLPVFCRWRGTPDWAGTALEELLGVADRLVVDSSEWRGSLPRGYAELAARFDRVAASDIAWRRTLHWRIALAELWPGIRSARRLTVEGPRADAMLLAGWLESRLRHEIKLTRRSADTTEAVWVDGDPVGSPPGGSASGSDLLSAELDVYSRDRIFEAAVRAAAKA
jgi:glucose-6-phosphate dehydrogenase assembly protein OpcA